jgi:hypothetical protein
MSQLILSEAAVFSLGMVVLAWVSHRRFTQKVADTAPSLLAASGILASLLAVALAQFATAPPDGGPILQRWDLGVAFLTSAVGLACALSIKARYALLGIPADLAIDPGPSNGELLSALDRQLSLMELNRQALQHFEQMTIGNAAGSLLTNVERLRIQQEERLRALHESIDAIGAQQARFAGQTSSQMERSHAALADLAADHMASHEQMTAWAEHLRQAFDALSEKQAAHNLAMKSGLREVVEDFTARITAQLRDSLEKLDEALAATLAVQSRHVSQVTEMMHHERRSADQIARATDGFHKLVERSSALASVADEIQRSAELLGPRQEAIALSLNGLTEVVSNSQAANDAISRRLAQLRSDLEDSIQHTGEKIRRQIAEDAIKARQQAVSYSKELEALNRSSGSQAQLLASLSSKLTSDLGTLAQQSKRLLELSKSGRSN